MVVKLVLALPDFSKSRFRFVVTHSKVICDEESGQTEALVV